MLKKLFEWIKRAVKAFFHTAKDVVLDVIKHPDVVLIGALATIGLTAILSELAFHVALPLWIEAPLVIPVIAAINIFCIFALMNEYEKCYA